MKDHEDQQHVSGHLAELVGDARCLAGPLPPLVGFGRDLRARGLPVGTGRILTFCRAVAALGLTDRDSLYWAGRTTLVASRVDLLAYDEAFDAWYGSLRPAAEPALESS